MLIVSPDQENVIKSFRNLDRALVVEPSEIEVATIVWARALLVTEDALELLPAEGVVSLHPSEIVISSGGLGEELRRDRERQVLVPRAPDAHKTQVRQAVEELFDVKVAAVNIVKVRSKPKRRGLIKGTRPGWKKAIVKLHPGQEIELFGAPNL